MMGMGTTRTETWMEDFKIIALEAWGDKMDMETTITLHMEYKNLNTIITIIRDQTLIKTTKAIKIS
jgi:hypothetical protein